MEVNAYLVVGMMVPTLVSIVGVYFTVTENTKKSVEPLHKLEISITRLTTIVENNLKDGERRETAITKQGKEIDAIKDDVTEAKHELSNHEGRIKSIENKIELVSRET